MRRLLTSCFGLGWLPLAPGTWGSLPPMLIFVLLGGLSGSALSNSIVMAVLVLAGSFVCVKFAPAVITATGKTDPGEVVADEFAGQAVVFLIISAVSTGQILATAIIAFLLFRFFDITKPWPIRRLERLPAGWGILADDLAAGIYAAIALLFCLRIGLVSYVSESFSSDGSSLSAFYAAVLGAVQGLTEFLPVSSSGHLALFENFLDFSPERPEMLMFDLAVHVGTVVAIFVVFRKSIAAFLKNLTELDKYGRTPIEIYKKSPSVHLFVLAIFATAVTAACGLLLKKYFIAARGNLAIVASMWIITGTLLLVTDWRKSAHLSLRQFTVWQATLVGLAQAAAIMPGISRSGATICAAILIGLRRRWAVEFSFLIAIPAILGATAIQLVQDFAQISCGTLSISAVLTGTATAAIVGILALKVLIKMTRCANLKVFAIYCYILAALLAVYLLSGR